MFNDTVMLALTVTPTVLVRLGFLQTTRRLHTQQKPTLLINHTLELISMMLTINNTTYNKATGHHHPLKRHPLPLKGKICGPMVRGLV